MNIISAYKDYYDYVGHQFGKDELLVYKRGKSINFKQIGFEHCTELKCLGKTNLNTYHQTGKSYSGYVANVTKLPQDTISNVCLELLIVCGVPYPVLCFTYQPEFMNITQRRILISKESFNRFYYKKGHRYFSSLADYVNVLEIENLDCINWSKQLQKPVFLIKQITGRVKLHTQYFVNVYDNTPSLEELQFFQYCDAYQCYQNIAQFIATHFVSTDPPIELNNSERIVKAGFDIKKSFRHR